MVSKRKLVLLVIALSLLFVITSCGKSAPTQDPNQKITEIYLTVQAELTKVFALTPSSTPTLEVTVTPTLSTITPTLSTLTVSPTTTQVIFSPDGGNSLKYQGDVTIPDGSLIAPGTTFVKTWSVLNNGTTTWTKDYQIIYIDGTQTTNLTVKLTKDVAPGELAQISINFIAPSTLGTYISWWQLVSTDGLRFGDPLSVSFTVGTETPTPTSSATTPTATITTTPTP